MNHRLGIVEAEITSARPLEEAESRELLAEVSRVTGKQVSAQYKIRSIADWRRGHSGGKHRV